MSTITCPSCGSERTWRDGIRRTRNGDVQRYLCRSCEYRFSETCWNSCDDTEYVQRIHRESLNTHPKLLSNRQVGVTQPKGAKNLVKVESRIEKRAAGATKVDSSTFKGKIVEYAWRLKKEGYKESTIRTYSRYLGTLVKRGADLYDPESVKDVIARQEGWRPSSKALAVATYTLFACVNGISWAPPKYEQTRKLPFIPLENEIDALIASAGRKMAAVLQLLKEVPIRIGEACLLKWIELDSERNTITLNETEKSGLPRMFKVSTRLVTMLNALPRKNEYIFGGMKANYAARYLWHLRKRVAHKLQNPRILRIHLHTFRHWNATMEYHKTKDILYVMKRLGHRRIENTLIYTQLVEFESDDYHSAVAENVEEARKLIEAGFEYVCTHKNIMLFRKRK